MSRRARLDIAIVGGGVVGAACALSLAKLGLEVALIEGREPAHWSADTPDLRVYAFAPDNAALLGGLGVWDSVRSARVQAYRRMRVWDASGGGELSFDADMLGRDQLGWIVENKGMPPDVEIEQDPAAVIAGRDPQLEKAIELTLKKLEEKPVAADKRPPFKKVTARVTGAAGGAASQ